MSLDVDQREIADIVAELDRQITVTLTRCVRARKRTVEMLCDVAARVQTLEAAKATWTHYGHRALRLSKGAEIG